MGKWKGEGGEEEVYSCVDRYSYFAVGTDRVGPVLWLSGAVLLHTKQIEIVHDAEGKDLFSKREPQDLCLQSIQCPPTVANYQMSLPLTSFAYCMILN